MTKNSCLRVANAALWRCVVAGIACLIALSAGPARAAAGADTAADASEQAGGPADADAGTGYSWTRTVDKSQAEQPHWMTPLVTVTPRLEEEVRYDQVWQARANDANFTNYGNTKGLELIPLEPVEVILGIPGYETLDTPKGTKEGWADETFLVKYRILSSNEEHDNYILSAFMGVSVPTGSATFTSGYTMWTPTIAGGKGWGSRTNGFDVQSTLAMTFPSANEKVLGEPLVWNVAFQPHIFEEHLWPELELNYTHFHDGPNDGKNQLMYTLGLIVGRFPVTGRLRLVLGAGYEQALTSFRTFNHAWILTVRTPF